MSITISSECCSIEKIISHNLGDSHLDKADVIARQLTDDEFTLLEQLSQFDLGKFLLDNKGLNGYWTSYVINRGKGDKSHHPLEEWLLYKAPTVKATQERFRIFQQVLQSRLRDNIVIASIPCGLMDDLLTLDYQSIKNIQLVGIDLDKNSLELADIQSKKIGLEDNVKFIQSNAWELNNFEFFDVITSNGLNIYEPDRSKVVSLYKEFYKALKPKGILVTSFLTPPPALSTESTWKNYNAQDLIKQKLIFSDLIGVKWQSFNTESEIMSQLKEAGFSIKEVIYDSQGMFPTVVAEKG